MAGQRVWTDEQAEFAIRMFQDGMSCGHTSEAMCARGWYYTKSAVISKLRCLGYVRGTQRGVTRLPYVGRGKRKPPKPVMIETTTALRIKSGYPLMQLAAHSCRWPIGLDDNREHLFCGAPGEFFGYCPDHRARSVWKSAWADERAAL